MARDGILLESGTNEVEILDFIVRGQSFGVNVAKVKEILQYMPEKVTRMRTAPPSVLGVCFLRGHTFPVIDLVHHLFDTPHDPEKSKVIVVAEFNQKVTGFLVEGVNRIYRISWKDLTPVSEALNSANATVSGSFHIENREVLILDLEAIIAELIPEVRMQEVQVEKLEIDRKKLRGGKRILLAEDSTMIRKEMLRLITSVGYENVVSFDNGQSAFEAISTHLSEARAEGKTLSDRLDLIISDIEMPGMDGLTLCNHLKNEMRETKVPLIIFSSLINEQMALKCQKVGADAFITKPEINKLIDLIDSFCLKP